MKVDLKTKERLMNANLHQKIKDYVNQNCNIIGGKVEGVDIIYVTPPQYGKMGHFMGVCYLYKPNSPDTPGPTMIINGDLYQNLTIQKVCASSSKTGKWVNVKNITIEFEQRELQ